MKRLLFYLLITFFLGTFVLISALEILQTMKMVELTERLNFVEKLYQTLWNERPLRQLERILPGR